MLSPQIPKDETENNAASTDAVQGEITPLEASVTSLVESRSEVEQLCLAYDEFFSMGSDLERHSDNHLGTLLQVFNSRYHRIRTAYNSPTMSANARRSDSVNSDIARFRSSFEQRIDSFPRPPRNDIFLQMELGTFVNPDLLRTILKNPDAFLDSVNSERPDHQLTRGDLKLHLQNLLGRVSTQRYDYTVAFKASSSSLNRYTEQPNWLAGIAPESNQALQIMRGTRQEISQGVNTQCNSAISELSRLRDRSDSLENIMLSLLDEVLKDPSDDVQESL